MRSFPVVALLVSVALTLGSSPATAADLAAYEAALPGKVRALSVDPAEIRLQGPFEYRQLVIRGTLDNGEVVDLTRAAKIEGDKQLLTIAENRLVRPAADGVGKLRISFGDQSIETPVAVSGSGAEYEPDYIRDVMPAMSKMGCNAGTCHGSKDGKNGFQLSLRGYDPTHDYRALTDDIAGRRFNRAAPEQSLMLLKPTGVVPHEGGVTMQPGDPYYQIMRNWIAGGVQLDLDAPRVAQIEVFPNDVVIPLPGMKQQLKVIATYTDGGRRDVTAESFIEPSNIEVLSIDSGGLVDTLRRGEAAALARYEGAYAAARIVVMGDRTGYAWQETPAYNYIDELVYEKQRQVKVLPSGLCTDAEFIRRVYLDLTGLPPTADEVTAFIDDARDSKLKRDELVDKLIGSPEYVDHWTSKWADLLQVNAKFLGNEGAKQFRDWIRGHVESNTPYDQFSYEVLTASGSNMENPAAAYYKILREPTDVMENTTQLFLSIRFNCNKCHDHPFERWTQDQYYELSAYFAQVKRDADPKYKDKKIGGTSVEQAVPLVEVVSDGDKGEVKHDLTGLVTPPAFPYEHGAMPAGEGQRREQLARWLTAAENPYFAKSYANRIWSYLTGVGLIEPVDDIRAGNPPSNPALLDRLTQEFISSGFDTRQLMATICKSRTYQLSIETNKWNEGDEVNYTHAKPRRLKAEVLFDAVHRVTGSQAKLPGLPPGARAAEIINPEQKLSDGFLDMFGRPPRESACECERSDSMLLGPVMNLINGPTIANAITDPNNRVTKLVAEQADDREVVKQLFLWILNRPATEAEVEASVAAMQADLFAQEIAAAEQELAEATARIDARQAAWETTLAGPVWTPLELADPTSAAGATFAKQEDGSLLVEGNLDLDTYTFSATTPLQSITGIRLEVLSDDRLPGKGPGRSPSNGNFVLNEFSVTAAPNVDSNVAAEKLSLANAKADFSQDNYSVTGAIDGNADSGWAISPQFGKSHTALFETVGDATYAGGAKLQFALDQRYKDKKHTIGRFRVSVTDSPRPHTLTGPPANIAAIVALPAADRNEAQQAELAAYHRQQYPELSERQTVLNQLRARGAGNARLVGAQDVTWALINSPAFLFNR
ncbi:MAG: DUF1549 and DUF1553 domain-containing protein [Pirellulales bacterium]